MLETVLSNCYLNRYNSNAPDLIPRSEFAQIKDNRFNPSITNIHGILILDGSSDYDAHVSNNSQKFDFCKTFARITSTAASNFKFNLNSELPNYIKVPW